MALFYGLQRALFDGALVPGATLLFTVSGGETPVSIFSDSALRVPLPNPIPADAAGRWPPIYLAHTILYRVRMYGPDGALLREAEPYHPSPPPQVQALDDSGRPLPFAVLTFWRSETDQLQPIYATPLLDDELPNPITADVAGIFPPIYLDPELLYRVRLETAAGVQRYDIDPYLSPDAASFLTSRPYDTETIEALGTFGSFLGESPNTLLIEALESSGLWVSGHLGDPLREYTDGEPEALETSGDWIDGELRDVLLAYTDGEPEALETSGDWIDGELREALQTYTNYPTEALETSGLWVSGSFS